MKHLALEEGWAPLFMYAPRNHEAHARVKRHLMAKGDEFTFIPATDGDWETIREETLRALRKGHAAQVPLLFLYAPKFTVHISRTRLINYTRSVSCAYPKHGFCR